MTSGASSRKRQRCAATRVTPRAHTACAVLALAWLCEEALHVVHHVFCQRRHARRVHPRRPTQT
eukprot:CAMPEP_0196729946 /NCGR_PEP_ID=MMETSP1091-20130531/10144_1 /TAXON_ID=302021 /ORGANISM="Rhodomonas sp., Strain CCMP768" /LENGTH=63 /DNA_ID=CAMNT_0042072873 /DNA_START=112 /DNA_END=300 /DNA_ORIENTATION=+